MDFLDLPREPLDHEGAKIVPLFTNWPYKYDGGPFLQYQEKYPNAIFGDGTGLKYEVEIEYHYQNWLFFGLLHEVLGDDFHEENFVCWDDERQQYLLTTQGLPQILEHWHNSRSELVHASDPDFKQLSDCLSEVWEVLELTDRFFPGHGEALGLQIDVVAAVAEAIMNTLHKRTTKVLNREGNSFQWLSVSYQGRSEVLTRTTNKMVAEGGWCRNDINRALTIFGSAEGWHFIRHLKLSSDITLHAKCGLNDCRVAGRSNEVMLPRHVNANCRCKSIRISNRRLSQIYRCGGVPCIRLWQDRDRELRHDWNTINLGRDKARYHALSHVWSQGTGNSYDNALPRCQLLALFNAIEPWRDARYPTEIGQSITLWVDTLCCPFKQGLGKNLALSTMRDIYKNATAVHVWDDTLRVWSCKNGRNTTGQPYSLEFQIRVIFSPWMRRLWTLQESIFAGSEDHSNVVVHTADGCNSMTAIYRVAAAIERFASTFAFNASGELVWIDGARSAWVGRGGEYFPGMLNKAAQLLQYRSTSVASDEPLVLANLFGFKIKKYLDRGRDRGICTFWSDLDAAEVGSIPKDIVFCPTQKLSIPGYRWAPRTLLDARKHTPFVFYAGYFVNGITPRSTCQITSCGLRAKYKGVRILPRACPKARCFLGRHDTDCGQMFVNVNIPLSSGDWLRASCIFDDDDDFEIEKLYKMFRRLRAGNLAFLVQKPDILFEPTKTHAYQLIYQREENHVHYAAMEQYAVVGKYREYPVILEEAAQRCALHMLQVLEETESEIHKDDSTFLDHHVRAFLQQHPNICDVTRQNSREDLNAKKHWTFEQVVNEFKTRVHHQGHIGPIEVIEFDRDTEWCLD